MKGGYHENISKLLLHALQFAIEGVFRSAVHATFLRVAGSSRELRERLSPSVKAMLCVLR